MSKYGRELHTLIAMEIKSKKPAKQCDPRESSGTLIVKDWRRIAEERKKAPFELIERGRSL